MSNASRTDTVSEALMSGNKPDFTNNSGSVICVDLDGTLVRTDTLIEIVLLFIRSYPFRIPLLIAWLLRGRAYMKMKLAQTVAPDATAWPYNDEVLSYISSRKTAGARLVLATGADRAIADNVAQHLLIFDEVCSSDGCRNLVGEHKAELLGRRYSAFEYVENSRADLPVWFRAGRAAVVSRSRRLFEALEKRSIPAQPITPREPADLSVWIRLVRARQWVKNVLVFLPLITSHTLTDWRRLGFAAIGFGAWCLVASGAYIVNDLFDLHADRSHPRKRQRPLAAGVVSPVLALFVALVFFVAGVGLSCLLPPEATLLLLAYVVVAVAYSIWFKRFLFADVLVLVSFYLARIMFGGLTTGIEISVWLLAFSMFFFLSLALMKRHTELLALKNSDGRSSAYSSRGYQLVDLEVIGPVSAASALLSVVLLALYINTSEAHLLYRHPSWLWMICMLIIYSLTRMLLIANRGQLHDDPIVFAIRDRSSWAVMIAAAVLLILAT